MTYVCVFGVLLCRGPLMPLQSMKQLNLSTFEAMWMWATGSPPKRFQHTGGWQLTACIHATAP
jgi:hypothetical protein